MTPITTRQIDYSQKLDAELLINLLNHYAEDPMDMTGPPTQNLDKIYLLKGGDPKQKILIADKMWAVMGMELVRNKLYVVHAPHVTVFTLDSNGNISSFHAHA